MMCLEKQLEMLHIGGYLDSEVLLRDLTNGKVEFERIKQFIQDNGVDDQRRLAQLRCLWTAYCIHNDMECDTSAYDNALLELWHTMEEHGDTFWGNFDAFSNFMCYFLV